MGTRRMLNVGQAADYIGAHPIPFANGRTAGLSRCLARREATGGSRQTISTTSSEYGSTERPRRLTRPMGTGVFQYGLAAGIGKAHRPDPQEPVSGGLSALDQHVVFEAAGLRD